MQLVLVLLISVFTEMKQKVEETDDLVEFCGKSNTISKKIVLSIPH